MAVGVLSQAGGCVLRAGDGDGPGIADDDAPSDAGPAQGDPEIPGGGTILFRDSFDDGSLAARGWYDDPTATITAIDPVAGAGAFECAFVQGATDCTGGRPARHPFTASETVYISFYLKLSPTWVGSTFPEQPFLIHLLTQIDDDFIGPGATHLTGQVQVIGGRGTLALQDSLNVDPSCVLQDDGTFVGCDGDFDAFEFGEARSVCACNGLAGDVDGSSCFGSGTTWHSARTWSTAELAFADTAGAFDKTEWHFIEAYFEMNSIVDGVGVPDAKIRWVQDGQTLIQRDAVLMRTGATPDLAFDQFGLMPFIGDGSPADQTLWLDELTVATARP